MVAKFQNKIELNPNGREAPVRINISKVKTTLTLIITVFAFLIYAQSIAFDYAYDDITVTKNNSVTTLGIKGIPTILKTDYWYGNANNLRGEYRPVPLIIFALEWEFFPHNPHVGHLINVLIYAITCGFLFILLCKLFSEKYSLLLPLICVILYAAHPIHTEVVDNIKSLDELLCFLFGIMAIWFAVKGRDKLSLMNIFLMATCFTLALLSKETGISFVIIIPLSLYVITEISFKKIIPVFGSLVMITVLWLVIRYQVLKIIPHDYFISPVDNSLLITTDFISQKATAIYILGRYVLLLLYPHPLSYDYSFDQIPLHNVFDWQTLVSIAFYGFLFLFALIKIRSRNYLAFAILFYLITIAPVSNLFIPIGSTIGERFLFMPSLGFCLALGILLVKLLKVNINIPYQTISQFLSMNIKVLAVVLVLIVFYSVITITRNPVWKDNISLFGHDVEVSDNSARTHYNWANAIALEIYPKEKNQLVKDSLLDRAFLEINKSIAIFKGFGDAYTSLGTIYYEKKNYSDAIKNYEHARRLMTVPSPNLFNNLGLVYQKTNQMKESLEALDSAIKYSPANVEAHNNRGNALAGLGRYEESLKEFQKTIDLNPLYAKAYLNMGITYLDTKNYPKAIEYFNKYLSFDTTNIDMVATIGKIYQAMGDTINSRPYYERVKNLSKGLGVQKHL